MEITVNDILIDKYTIDDGQNEPLIYISHKDGSKAIVNIKGCKNLGEIQKLIWQK